MITATITAGVVLTARVKVLREINETFVEVEVIHGNGGWSKPGKVITARKSIMSDIREEEKPVKPARVIFTPSAREVQPFPGMVLVESPELVEARAELARLEKAMVANFETPGGGRGKQGLQRTDAQIRRGAIFVRKIQAAEIWVKTLLAATECAARPVTSEQLRSAVAVKTKFGWHRVVRVNAKTVTVATGYSWNDRIAVGSIVDVR